MLEALAIHSHSQGATRLQEYPLAHGQAADVPVHAADAPVAVYVAGCVIDIDELELLVVLVVVVLLVVVLVVLVVVVGVGVFETVIVVVPAGNVIVVVTVAWHEDGPPVLSGRSGTM